jgi:ankyrin repeat protein
MKQTKLFKKAFKIDSPPSPTQRRGRTASFESNSIEYFSARLNRDGLTPLHKVVINADKDALIAIFTKKGFYIDIRDKKDDRTALQWAARLGHVAIVKMLLEKKPSIDSKDNDGRTALQWAAIEGRAGVVTLLLEKGASVIETGDRLRRGALHWAAMKGYHEIVVMLIEKKPSIVNSEDFYGRTPLIWAAMEGHSMVVEALLSHGARSECVDSLHKRTALHWASYNGHQEVVRYLTCPVLPNLDMPLTLRDKGGRTATHLVAEQGYPDIMQLLLDSTANLKSETQFHIPQADEKDGYLRTPLHWAAENGHRAVAELLLSQGVDARVDNKLGSSSKNGKVMRDTNTKEQRVNAPDADGRTPLLIASLQGQDRMVEFLLQQGAKTEVEDNSRQTALHAAAQRGHPTTVQILLDKGKMQPKINEKDVTGRTALDWAAAEEKEKEREKEESKEGIRADGQLELPGHEEVVEKTGQNEHGDGIGNPLQRAAEGPQERKQERGKPELTAVEVLLIAGADPGAENSEGEVDDEEIWNQESRSALELAAWRGNSKALKVLLRHKDTGSALRALYWAASGYDEAVRVESKSENLLPEKDRRTTLNWPPKNEPQQVVHLLLEANAGRKSEELVSHVLKKNATLEAKDVLRQIALRFAISKGNNDLVKKVLDDGTSKRYEDDNKGELDIGINLHMRDYATGQTALHLAAQQKTDAEAIVKLLLQFNAPVEAKDRKRQSALHLAAKAGNRGVVEHLLDWVMKEEERSGDGPGGSGTGTQAMVSKRLQEFIRAVDYDGKMSIDVAEDSDIKTLLRAKADFIGSVEKIPRETDVQVHEVT